MGPAMQTHHLQIDQLNHLNQTVQRFRAHQNHQEIHRLSPIRIHPSNMRSKSLEHDVGNQHLFDGLQGKDDDNNGVHDLSQAHVSQGNIFSENEDDEILDQQDDDEDEDEEENNENRDKDSCKY